MTVYLFHVVEEKTQKSLSFCKRVRRNVQRGKSFRIHSIRYRADVLAASDRGSHVEQEKLVTLDEEEQSRWENETIYY